MIIKISEYYINLSEMIYSFSMIDQIQIYFNGGSQLTLKGEDKKALETELDWLTAERNKDA